MGLACIANNPHPFFYSSARACVVEALKQHPLPVNGMSARETSDFFSATGNIESINNVPESGNWEYRYDKANADYSLKINSRLTPEDTDTLGSRSGYWSNTKSFIHVAEIHWFNETIKDDIFGYMVAWGKPSVFEAVSMPANSDTEKIYGTLRRLPTSLLLGAVKNWINASARTGYDVFRGKTTGTIHKLPSDNPPVEKDVPRDRMRNQNDELFEEVISERAVSASLAAFAWFMISFSLAYNFWFQSNTPVYKFVFSLIISIISGFLLRLVGYRELLDKLDFSKILGSE